ncbi:MAG: hypothetical protein F6K11_12560 [Leptolyngbya sp. SIO3F4]|nr:hypothetical protein [Leptolyngbya sp. SIO3F4]
MIISRRKAHLFVSIALAVVLPIIFLAGIFFRPTYATVTPDTEQLFSHSGENNMLAQPQKPTSADDNPIATFLQQ